MSVKAGELPEHALLRELVRQTGCYADCYVIDVPGRVSHAAYVEAFYTGWVFKIERLLIRALLSRPSTDAQARQLAAGSLDSFAAWKVEGRAREQILMADVTGRTKSWLMVASIGEKGTRLYFGSAVMPVRRKKPLGPRWASGVMLGFHKLYSRVLLRGAAARVPSISP
jgi:hypothetical protein